MPSKLNFSLIFTLVCVSVNCFSNIQQNSVQLTYEQGAIRRSSLSRFRRENPVFGYNNYRQGSAVQPSVVVIPSVVPPLYRGPGSSYGPSTYTGAQSYGAQRVPYGANSPTVVVNMPDDNYIVPVVNNPYAVPSTRL